jgi:hypothetical protein
MTKAQVLERLRKDCDDAGGIRAWSRGNGFSASFISDVLSGKIDPSKNLLRLLGYEAVKLVKYRPISKMPGAEAAA